MIPKIIHYCWFGGKPKPQLAQKCIESWKKFCPDYQIIEWNEENYDVNSAPLFVREAIKAQKWAFATDFIRLKVIYEYGGIYLDTDVELIKSLDSLLDNKIYFGFERLPRIATGLGFGAEKGLELLCEFMQTYENRSFISPDGKRDMTWNTINETNVLIKHGLNTDGSEQLLEGYIHILPWEYLCPLNQEETHPRLTEKTISIHWYASSWWDTAQFRKFGPKWYKRIMYVLRLPNRIGKKLLGEERYDRLKKKMKSLKK